MPTARPLFLYRARVRRGASTTFVPSLYLLINVGLFIAAGAAFAWACVGYARASWRTNDDLIGASLVFVFFWLLGTSFLVLGLIRAAGLNMELTVAGFVVSVILGKLIEWFVIMPVLHRLFRTYRRDE